jgi:hypothetical protein
MSSPGLKLYGVSRVLRYRYFEEYHITIIQSRPDHHSPVFSAVVFRSEGFEISVKALPNAKAALTNLHLIYTA